jgi:hypothetical protein
MSIRPIFSATSLALAASLFLAGCGGSGNGSDSSISLVGQFKTLDGKQPLVIAVPAGIFLSIHCKPMI